MLLLAGCAAGSSDDGSKAPSDSADAALADMLPANIRDAGVLNVGVAPGFYPNAYFPEGSDKLAGVDPDLLAAVAEKLGVKVNWITADFPSLVVGVASGKFDIAMGDISDTPVREEQVTFVDYLLSYRMVYTQAANPHNISGERLSLCGLSAPYQSATITGDVMDAISKECEAAGKKPIDIIPVSNHDAIQLAVDSGRADFGMTAGSEGAGFDKQAPGKYKHWKLDGSPMIPSGIATPRDATDLQQALLAGLKAVQADGTYAALLKKYTLEEGTLDEFGINLGSK